MNIQHPRSSKVVGLDFGSTYSSVAWMDKNNHIQCIDLECGFMMHSSVKYCNNQKTIGIEPRGDNSVLFNLKMYINNPNYKQTHIESRLINGIPYISTGQEYKSIIDIIADILIHMRHKVNQFFAEDIRHAVLAMPARFNEVQKQWLIQAAIKAGWIIVRTITEPTAAFMSQSYNEDGIYGIYDLGGSTFDFSLVKKCQDIIQVIATDGLLNIGIEHIFNKIFAAQSDTDQSITAPHNFNIDKTIFEENPYAQQSIQKTIEILLDVIRQSNVEQDQIKSITLIGGGAHIQSIKSKLDALKLPTTISQEPQLAVCKGAAVYAKNLTDKNSCLLLDVAPLSLGVEIYNGMIETIIHKNSPLPISRSVNFTNIDSKQTHITLNIFQGDSNFVDECQQIAQLEIPIEPGKINTRNIKVNFELDHNNVLNIHAIDIDTGSKTSLTIDTKNGLTLEMVNRLKSHQYLQNNIAFAKQLSKIDKILASLHPKYAYKLLQRRSEIVNLEDAKSLLRELDTYKKELDFNALLATSQKIYDSQTKGE